MLQALNAFLSARSWMDPHRNVQAHPELVSDDVLALLEQAIAAAERAGNNDVVAFFTEHRDLLRRCVEIGVNAEFAEKPSVNSW